MQEPRNQDKTRLITGFARSSKELAMNLTIPAVLACALPFCLASAAKATSFSGSPAMALAAIAAAHSPTLSAAEKKAVAAIFDGKAAFTKGKIIIAVDKIVCRISNVAIASRSCELTFGKKAQSFTGREANELYATEVFAGIPSDGAAGSIYESLSKLKCTLDPNAIKQNDGSGADCSYEAP
jgi:hypothetical protein